MTQLTFNLNEDPKEYIFTFGKYKGRKLTEVLDKSPSYVHWCVSNMQWFKDILKKDFPKVYDDLLKTEKGLQSSVEAWAYTGGRIPTFDSLYFSILTHKKD